MDNEKTILNDLKKNWFVYVPRTQFNGPDDPQYKIISDLTGNNPKYIKTVRVYGNHEIILMKKNSKTDKVLKLKKEQIKKLVAIWMLDDQVLADFSTTDEFIKKFEKFIDDGLEREKENMSMYR